MTEDERIVSQLGNKNKLLEETLNAHRFAISLNPENTDILFNTAQVLTSLAEVLLESGSVATTKYDARPLLEEAVEIFTRCLEAQQQEYAQMQAEIANATASGEYQEAWEGERQQPVEASDADAMEDSSASSETQGDWATVEAPLTPESILETCTAQLGALITLLGLYDVMVDLPNMEKKAQDGLETSSTKIPALIDLIDKSPSTKAAPEPQAGPTLSIGSTSAAEEATTSPKEDANLAVANFQASIAEMKFRSASFTSTQYAQAVEQIFSPLISDTTGATTLDLASINIRSAYADALMDFASALADGAQYTPSSPTFASDTEIQWIALTQAQTILTKLSSAPYTSILSATRLANTLLARGDTDLFRFRISSFVIAKPAWTKSRPVLVANAGVFYRGARSYAEKAGSSEVQSVADAKASVAELLKEVSSGATLTRESWKGRTAGVEKVAAQMIEEGIIDASISGAL